MSEVLPIWAMPASNYTVRREYLTEIITSRGGQEQRRAGRDSPRKHIEFTVGMQIGLWHKLNQMLVAGQRTSWFIPDQSRITTLAVELVTSSPAIATLTSVPSWILDGAGIILHDGLRLEYHTITAIAGNDITLGGIVDETWPVGTNVYPALEGYLDAQLRSTIVAREGLVITIGFEVDPTTEPVDPPTAAAETFNGREVFRIQPLHIAPVEISRDQYREAVDFGRGVVSRFHPVEFSTRIYRASWPTISVETQNELRSLQDRMKGARGEFYMPTYENDLPPKVQATAGTNTLTVEGTEAAATYADSTTYKAVAVYLPDGTVEFNLVTSVVISGLDSLFTFENNWVNDITVDSDVCWMPAWRFATDTVETEWLFQRGGEDAPVASMLLNFQMLEDLAPDTLSP